MLDNLSGSILEVISAVAVAVVFAFFTIKKLVLNWSSTSAESSIIQLMHSELERMSAQNVVLSNEISRLHSEIIELNKQLRDLTQENQRLHEQVVELTKELNSFKATVLVRGV